MKKFLFLSIFLLISFISYGAEREGDLAVLPLRQGKGLPPGVDLDFLTQVVREEAVNLTNYRVMTKENVLVIMRDKGIDITKCYEAECEVEFGRMLQVDKLVVGNLNLIEGVYYLSLSLYDISSAAIDRAVSKECHRCGFSDIVSMTREGTRELFGGLKAPMPHKGVVKVFAYDENGNPLKADVYVDGAKVGSSPGSFKLLAGKHKVEVRKGDRKWSKKIYVKKGEVLELSARIEIGKREKKKVIGVFIYPTINYSFSSINGFNYGAGAGYRLFAGKGLRPLIAFGMEWIGGEVSKDDLDGKVSFTGFWTMLGYDIAKDGRFGLYGKPVLNYQSINGYGESVDGVGFRGEGGIYTFFKPVHFFLGGFSDGELSGITISFGGFF